MINITIKVSGPGQCFDTEYYMILRMLLNAGYNVEENNPYPNPQPHTLDNKPGVTKIKLVADHQPWGG